MHRFRLPFNHGAFAIFSLLTLAAADAAGQSASYPYVLRTFAGSFPLGDGGPATNALLSGPNAVVVDGSSNVFVLDSTNYRIRKFAPGGTIGTVAQLGVVATDMKMGRDGSFYLTASGLVFKVSAAGATTVLAGNGIPGFRGDGGLAAGALVGSANAIALDSAGNIYFADGSRIREITLDGKIQTVAGTGIDGYDGDDKPAVSAQLFIPTGLAFDSANNLYIADTFSYRIRKIAPNGTITTVAGNGNVGQPVNGRATSTPMGVPHAVAVDASGNLYVSDVSFSEILKIGSDGTLTQVAGTPTFGYGDGPANSTYLFNVLGLAVDGSGSLYMAETSGNRVRVLSGGAVRTIAGRLHYGGDGGPATSALLYNAIDMVFDAQGNMFILDGGNFRIRKIGTDGTIGTFAGTGLAGVPAEGAAAVSAALPQFYSMAIDGQGNLYLGAFQKIYKITAAGAISTFAGTPGAATNSGDGGPAIKAQLNVVTALAFDSAGNLYVGDCCNARVRKIATDGTITAFAGTGTAGYTGDGGLATSARLSGFGPLTVDSQGNVYIGESGNNVVRRVTPNGIIATVAGNGTAGSPTDGATAKSAPLTAPAGLTVDAAGNLFVMSANYSIYRVDPAGVIHLVSGSGTAALADGLLANSTIGFNGKGIKVDANGDLYVADPAGNVIRKLVLDSPSGLAISDGNNQSAPVGTALPKALKVTVNGRGGAAVPGVTVNFSVTSGSATLSAATSQSDSAGSAGVGVTLGSAAGNVVITATIAGSALPAAQFTATGTALDPSCTIGPPVIASVKSLGDFGGFSSFGAGSWLEVKGTNLAIDTRLWSGDDFKGAAAPISLDGSRVSINGNAGFVEYISAGQINVQAPADAATGAVPVTVTNCAGTSAPVTVQKVSMAPGLLAPGSFNIGGKQYLVALFQDGVTFVGNTGLIAGVPFRPAKPGDSITAYGIGFGAVTPAIAPGAVVSQANAIASLAISFGQTAAATTYAGLAPGNIGLYQINITVPNVPDGDYQINVTAGGVAVAQTLYLTVKQ